MWFHLVSKIWIAIFTIVNSKGIYQPLSHNWIWGVMLRKQHGRPKTIYTGGLCKHTANVNRFTLVIALGQPPVYYIISYLWFIIKPPVKTQKVPPIQMFFSILVVQARRSSFVLQSPFNINSRIKRNWRWGCLMERALVLLSYMRS